MVNEEDLYDDGEEVIILSEQYFGYRGVIENRKKESLMIKLTKPSLQAKEKFE